MTVRHHRDCSINRGCDIDCGFEKRDEIDIALARLHVGITKESTPTCDWYEGIEFDAFDELVAAIRDLRAEED
jgi:hypothetical protein